MAQMDKEKVLFLCVANSARSQMAEGFLRSLAGERFEIHSAGLKPSQVNPYAVLAMKEIGIDISSHSSKSVSHYLGKVAFSYVISVCDEANAECPTIFPFARERLYWPFADPAECEEEKCLEKFRSVRDQIAEKIRSWLATLC